MDYSFPVIYNLLISLLGLEEYQVRLVLVKATCLWYSILQWLWGEEGTCNVPFTGTEISLKFIRSCDIWQLGTPPN